MRCAEAARLPETGEQTGAVITSEMIRSYLETLSRRGRSRNTVQMYGAKLRAFYHYLPSDKRVGPDTLSAWRGALLEAGYSPGTVNTHLSAANGLLGCLGRRDLQLAGQLEPEPSIQPELTRAGVPAATAGGQDAGERADVSAGEGVRPAGDSAGGVEPAHGGSGESWAAVGPGQGQAAVSFHSHLPAERAAGLRPVAGVADGPGVCDPKRKGHEPYPGDLGDPVPLPGCSGGEGQVQPLVPAEVISGHRSEIERNVRILAEQAYEQILDAEQLGTEDSGPRRRGKHGC